MTAVLDNEQHRRLLQLWHEQQEACPATASLTDLTSRDLSFFHCVLKDSLVIRGSQTGAFNLAFVGTDLETLLGRRLHNTPFGLGLATGDIVRVEQAFMGMVQARRPMLMSAELTSSRRADRLQGRILCVPLVGEVRPQHYAHIEESVTIFGLFALPGGRTLAPDPTHPHIEITATLIL